MSQTPLGHAAAQIDQVAQHIGLLMGELQQAIASAALTDGTGVPLSPGSPGSTLTEKMEELAADYAAFRGMLARHTTVLRSLV